MLRLPSARGPYSMRPRYQAITRPSAISLAADAHVAFEESKRCHLILPSKALKSGLNIAGGVVGSKERGGQPVVGNLLGKRGAIERGSQGHAVVAGHGLHINFIEQPRAHQLAVGGAVQGHASGQGDPPQPRLLRKVPADVKNHFVQALLQSGCRVLMV